MPQPKIVGSIQNIEKVYKQSDNVDIECGKLAYFKYNKLMQDLADKYKCSLDQAVAVFVSTSPNNDYKNNLRSTVSILKGWKEGTPEEKVRISTYNHCRHRAFEYLNGKDFLQNTKGLKIKSFYQNILEPNNPTPVTVDGHMLSVWSGKRMLMKIAAMSKFNYHEVAQGIRDMAFSLDLIPNQLQAILWLTWKRINHIVYNDNLNLFGDHWDYDIAVNYIRPFKYFEKVKYLYDFTSN